MGAEPPKPQRRRKDARPAELIDAGLKEFAARGFSGARLEDVARRAGVVKGTIYRYFEDKEALFVAAVRSRVPPFIDVIDQVVSGYSGTTRELLVYVMTSLYSQLVDSDLRVLMKIMITEGENFPALTELYHREALSKGRNLFARILERGVARGEIRPGAAAQFPMVLVAPVVMAAVWKMTFDRYEPIPTEAFFLAHMDLFDGIFLDTTVSGPGPGRSTA
jgi:AcrR family transcriptional regulator